MTVSSTRTAGVSVVAAPLMACSTRIMSPRVNIGGLRCSQDLVVEALREGHCMVLGQLQLHRRAEDQTGRHFGQMPTHERKVSPRPACSTPLPTRDTRHTTARVKQGECSVRPPSRSDSFRSCYYFEYGASCLTPATTRASTTCCHWVERPTSTAAGRASISQSGSMESSRGATDSIVWGIDQQSPRGGTAKHARSAGGGTQYESYVVYNAGISRIQYRDQLYTI